MSRKEPEKTLKKIETCKISIVGTGEAYATCGEYAGRHICPSCGNSIARLHHCIRWDCSKCWPHAVAQALRRIRPRLEAIPERIGHWKHWVIYPPRTGLLGLTDKLAGMDISAVYALYLPVLRSILDVYGVMVLHPYKMSELGDAAVEAWRGTHPYESVPPSEPPDDDEHITPTYLNAPVSLVPAPEPARPRGDWLILREIGIRDEYIQQNLHFHVISRGYVPEWIEDDMREQGWLIHLIDERVRDTDDAVARLRYLFSHAGYDGHSQIYRYIHPLDTTFRKTSDGRRWELMKCIKCGDVMRYAAVDTPDDTRVCDLPESAVPVDDTTYELARNVTPSARLYSKLRRLAYRMRDRNGGEIK